MAQTTIFCTHTALPTTTSTTVDSEKTLPKGIKQIVGFSVDSIRDTVTAGKPGHVSVSLESQDIAVFNATWLANPVNPVLAAGSPGVAEMKFWPTYIPVTGGEKLTVKGQVLWDATDDPAMGATIYVSDQEPVLAQRKGVIGTSTALTGGTETVTDSALSINGGSVLETVYGVITLAGVVAATDPVYGYGLIRSADLLPFQSVRFGVNGAQGGLGTAAIASPGSAIEEVDIELAMASSVALEVSMQAESTATNNYRGEVGVTYV